MLEIIIDTREQAPWSFDPGQAVARVATLRTGDYALAGDQDCFSIERKSLDDFLGTISSGWERFQCEIERMKDFPAKVMIIEGDFAEMCFIENEGGLHPPEHMHYKLQPRFISKRIAQLALMGVCVLFAGNPEFASVLALQIFRERKGQIENS